MQKPGLRTLLLAAALAALGGCSQDEQNKLARMGVSWLDGNYRVTYADGGFTKSWDVHDGKVTTDSQKGYYYFWALIDGKKRYVQTPIARSFVEELP